MSQSGRSCPPMPGDAHQSGAPGPDVASATPSSGMAERVAGFDWGATPLGPAELWPAELRTIVALTLATPIVSAVLCGPERRIIYNDAASCLYGDRHPGALGRPLADVFPEGWATVKPLYDRVFAGETVSVHAQEVNVAGAGAQIFDAWLTPVRGPDGTIAYAHMAGVEIGSRLRAEQDRAEALRRVQAAEAAQRFLLQLNDVLRGLDTPANIQEQACRMLRAHLGAARAGYGEDDLDAGGVRIVQQSAEGVALLAANYSYGEIGSALTQAIAERRIAVCPDIAAEMSLSLQERAWHLGRGIGASLTVPVIKPGGPAAVLFVHYANAHVFDPGEIALVRDVAGRIWTAAQAVRAQTVMRESEARWRSLVAGMPQLVWQSGACGNWTWASPQWTRFTGQDESASLGQGWLSAVHPDDRAVLRSSWHAADSAGALDVEHRLLHQSERRYRWMQTRAVPVRREDGGIEWLGTCTDVDDLRNVQERLQVMMTELQHRTRNLLTVIRSVAQETVASAATPKDFQERFGDRLDALARAQNFLSQSETQPVTIGALLRTQFDALGSEDRARVTLDGPDVMLQRSSVQTLALALHELGTNARKYGALAQPGGTLHVSWTLREDDRGRKLILDWRETAELPPDCDTSRRGYGRRLIEHALPYSLGARTAFALHSDGARCRIELPLPMHDG